MIKKLQHRFIFITMAGISFIFILILITINITMTISSRRQGYSMLADYAGKLNSRFSSGEKSPGSQEFPPAPFPNTEKYFQPDNDWFNNLLIFSVLYNEQGEITEIFAGENPNLTDEYIENLAARVMGRTKEQGSVSGYLYLRQHLADGDRLYFLDYAPEKNMSLRLFRICLWIGLAGMLVIFVLVTLLSRWVTKPVQLAFDRQKQFIADASHELKTPLAIITANAEVLESTLPGNKWLSHILEQSKRMRGLIISLLDLTKLDSYEQSQDFESQDFTSFDLSKTVYNTALSFESLAYEYNKHYTLEIQEELTLYGNENHIRQLVTILLDNAFNYSDDGGCIKIGLSRKGDKVKNQRFLTTELTVWNSGKGILPSDQAQIFERFYRSDASRSRNSGGYGLGLSIAQSIAEAHKGHIQVKSDGTAYTLFSVTLP